MTVLRRSSSAETAARFLALRARRPRQRRLTAAARREPRNQFQLVAWDTPARDHFDVGDRVVLSEFGRVRGIAKRSGRSGVVVGYSRRYPNCIRLLRDGKKQAETIAHAFWTREPREPLRLHAKPEALAARGLTPPMQTVAVPSDFVLYRCKIADGRVLNVPLPPRLTRRDVEKLHAALLALADDPAWETAPDERSRG